MYTVTALFSGSGHKTRIWVSPQAAKKIHECVLKKDKPKDALLKKLQRYATNGFQHYEGDHNPIRHEAHGVYRIGLPPKSLFRMIGFYEDHTKRDFIILDAYEKRGQKLGASDRDRIKHVAQVRNDQLWEKTQA